MQQQNNDIISDGTAYVGKRLLVGVTYKDANGNVTHQEQFHGPIVEASAGGLVMVRADNGARVNLPPELQKAEPGEYRLPTTGEVVIDPDFIATWVSSAPLPDCEPEAAE